jgi:hypothetical protein
MCKLRCRQLPNLFDTIIYHLIHNPVAVTVQQGQAGHDSALGSEPGPKRVDGVDGR